jgi:hypothetical protein
VKTIDTVVRGVLAHHVRRNASAICPWHQLDRDLDVTPLELALVALEIEDIQAIQLPMEGLASVETVGELFAFVSSAVVQARRAHLDRVA